MYSRYAAVLLQIKIIMMMTTTVSDR